MENNNNSDASNNSLIKGLLVVLAIFLLGAGVYIYQQTVDLKKIKLENARLDREKTESLNKLKELELTYEKALANNTSISGELEVEKQKVTALLLKLEKAKPNLAQLKNYRNQIAVYENKMNELLGQVSDLRQENTKLKMQRDSSMYVLKEYEKSNKVFYNKTGEADKSKNKTNPSTDNGIIKARNINDKLWSIKISDLKVTTFDSATNKDNPIETNNANNVDLVKIKFNIPTNYIIRASLRTYFIQIINDKGLFMGDNATVNFDDNSTLNYSFRINAPYKNKILQIDESLYCKNFKKGIYIVNVYDSNVLVDKTKFTLN